MKRKSSFLKCPSCGAPLGFDIQGALGECLQCPECAGEFPVLGGELPVLIDRADVHDLINDGYLSILKMIGTHETDRDRMRHLLEEGSARGDSIEYLLRGCETNLDFLESLAGDLAPFVSERQILRNILRADEKVDPIFYEDPFAFLYRDWSGAAECERELAEVLGQLAVIAPAGKKQPGLTLVLGAGAGRFASELAREHSDILALELSIPLALGYLKVVRDQKSVCLMNPVNARVFRSQVKFFNPKAKKTRKSSPRLKYCVATALDPPVQDGAASRIYSIFFSDVVPLSELIAVTGRLLKPGGEFIHFGPLKYHHADLFQYFTFEEVLKEFQESGFEVRVGPELKQDHLRVEGSMAYTGFYNQSFVAKKRS